ncbi:MAG TPA: dTDP-4-dehydrorhamnose reductase [Bacteroidota bacterium]|nr:dTDP-4-dehydrorhamnose reductase [Bacteroidota bacterium]
MSNEKYLILGSNGQLGKQFTVELTARNERVISPDEKECDITNFDSLARCIEEIAPTVILNCAAYNAVETAEEQPEIARLVNGKAVDHIASLAKLHRIFLVHYSTDYVFDGKKGDLYTEADRPNPLNIYGKSKLEGEEAVLRHGGSFLLFRTSWVFGNGPQNFIHKFLQWSRKTRIIKLSADEVSVPTSTADLVGLTLDSIGRGLTGLFHLTNSGYASRYEVGKLVAETLSLENLLIPVPMNSFASSVPRPAFTAMSNARLRQHLGKPIREWRSAVEQFLKEYPPA